MTARQCLPLLCAILAGALAVPTPGRIPKVYNALITSNQNLVPSKAYPVYQPVLHNVLPFPYQPIFYGDLPLTHGLIPVPAAIPKDANAKPEESPSATTETPRESEPADNSSPSAPEPNPSPEDDKPTPAPSSLEPPKTESPIPLNEFGLPPQVLPLGGGHFSPAYHYTQFTFPYTYPGLRLYDPYNPFGYNPYAALPLYQPITNILGAGVPVPSLPAPKPEAPVASSASSDQPSQTPPPEPSDLNVLNYSSKDPAIPNVPPPPLPQGGLKTNTK